MTHSPAKNPSQKRTGLTSKEAEHRLQEYGKNELTETNKRTLITIFFEQFQNVLILILLLAAGLALSLGEYIDSSLIFAIVLLNALFGVYQEKKAENAISALKEMTQTMVRVIRDGKEQEVPSQQIVPGDIVFIEEGVKVAADGRICEGTNIEVNEAGLTGESLPVAKGIDEEVYAGTIVTRGRALIEVTATGMKTKFGKIAAELSQIDKSKTLLEKKLEKFTKFLGFLGVTSSFIVIFLSWYQGSSLFTSVLLGVSLAVAVVPEGLPAVMTITLAMGVRQMAKRKAVLRKLSAIEALGSITVIATDKTGTLTTNSMRVKEVWVDEQQYAEEDYPSVKKVAFGHLVRNGLLCSTASLARTKGKHKWQILGDPTEGALLVLGKDLEQEYEDEREQWSTIYEQPFNSVDKRMSVTVKRNGDILTYAKGAAESILSISTHILSQGKKQKLTKEQKDTIRQVMEGWASQGLRVLAFSVKEQPKKVGELAARVSTVTGDERKKQEKLIDAEMEEQVFLGMVAMYDPPRPEAAEALKKAHTAGIAVTMVTGDNPKTAEAIGRSIGLFHDGDEILTGEEVEQLSDKELCERLPNVRIFARVSPFHKSRIVKLYQKMGEIVAVTGDGVNDSIALKQADVGVAMGLIGTDVARETADMVLTDDNFATLINAVEEGRNIIKNIKNAIKYLLSTNVVEAIVIIVGLMLGFPKMFTAIQLLYINLLSDGVPSLILSFSPREDDVMKRKPVRKVSLLNAFDTTYILGLGACAAVIVLGSFLYFNGVDGVSQRGVVFVILALIQPFFLIDLWVSHQSYIKHWREFTRPAFIGAFIYPFIILGVMMMTPSLAQIFKLEAMPWQVYVLGIAISATILLPIVLFTHFSKRLFTEE